MRIVRDIYSRVIRTEEDAVKLATSAGFTFGALLMIWAALELKGFM